MTTTAATPARAPHAAARATVHHRVLVVGGGTAGMSLAARLRRHGFHDIGIVEPSTLHFYQPGWTLVAAGRVAPEWTARETKSLVPAGVHWIHDRAEEVDPDARIVHTRTHQRVGYDFLVLAPGMQLDWGRVPGLEEALRTSAVTSVHRFDLAPKTWDALRAFRGGTALFTVPAGPVRAPGSALSAAFLAAALFRRRGLREASALVLAHGADALFPVPEYARALERVAVRRGVEVRARRELVEVRPQAREAVFAVGGGDETETVEYDLLHVTPPMSAPDFVRRGPLADGSAAGWVDVDPHTLRHVRYGDVFALGDAAALPTARTPAAIRRQLPVLERNLVRAMSNQEPDSRYDGRSATPVLTGGGVLLCETDYAGRPRPSVPLLDPFRPHRALYAAERFAAPFAYWHRMVRGRG